MTLGAEKLKSQSCKKVYGITNLYFQIDFQFLGFFLEGEGGYLFNSLWTDKKIMTSFPPPPSHQKKEERERAQKG